MADLDDSDDDDSDVSDKAGFANMFSNLKSAGQDAVQGMELTVQDMLRDDDSTDSIGHFSVDSPTGYSRADRQRRLSRKSSGEVSFDQTPDADGGARDVTMQLAVRPISVRKGQPLARLMINSHLEVSFKLQFQELPESTIAPRQGDLQFLADENQNWDIVSIFQVTVDGNLQSHWPSMRAAVRFKDEHEWLELITFVRLGGALLRTTHTVDLESATKPISVRVAVQTKPGPHGIIVCLDAEINGKLHKEQREENPTVVRVPEQAQAHIYFSSPLSVPAYAVVWEAVCNRHLSAAEENYQEKLSSKIYDMMMPKSVQLLQEKDLAEKQWVVFDSVFGILVIINGIWIGIEVSYNFETLVIVIVNNTFLAIFAIELYLRYRLSHIRIGAFLHDPWILLDIVIVLAGGYDAWLSDVVEAPFPPTVLRLVRLLRLGRMVRLLRLFRALGLLVDSMLSATQVVLWTLLLLMLFVYGAGIGMTKMTEFATDRHNGRDKIDPGDGRNATRAALVLHEWESLSNSMWQIMQMVTADDWGTRVRDMAFVVGGIEGVLMAGIMVVIMIIGTIGIMNMVVALLCRTAFNLHRQQREMQAARELGMQSKLLPRLRQYLQKHIAESTFGRRFGISTEELLTLYKESPELRDIFQGLQLSKADILTFGLVFEDDGYLDLEGMYEVIAGLQMEIFYKAAESQKFLFGHEAMTTLRPSDMLAYRTCYKLLEESSKDANRQVMGVCSFLHNLNRKMNEVMVDSCSIIKEDPVEVEKDYTADGLASKKDPDILREAWEAHLKSVDLESSEAKLSIRLDLLACIIIMINAILLGLQLEYKAFNRLWIDVVFTLIFVCEFLIRSVLYTHVRNLYEEIAAQNQSPQWIGTQFKAFQERMFLGIVPPFPIGGPQEVFWNMPQMLKDPMALFDGTIIVICIVDNILVAATGTSGQSFNSVGAFRVLRLLRLGIVLRVFAIFPKLQILLDAMIWTRSTIFWIACTMLLVVYGLCSTILLVVVGPDGKVENEAVAVHFGSLYSAVVSGWQIVTFDTWGPIVETTCADFPGASILICLLIGLGGLSAMNIGVAVMSEAAVRFTKIFEQKAQVKSLMNFLHQMTELEKVIVERLGAPVISADIIEAATGIHLSRRVNWAEDGPSFDPAIYRALTASKALTQDPDFIERLQLIFYEADLQPEYVKMIFEKTDTQCLGFTYVESFTQGALCTKRDLIRMDIFLSNIVLRSFRVQVAEMRQRITGCHRLAGHVLVQASALIQRKNLAEGNGDKNGLSSGHTLPERVSKAIDSINAWREEESLPFVRATGKLHVLRGAGRVNLEAGQSGRLNTSASRRPQGLKQGTTSSAAVEVVERDKIKGVGTNFLVDCSPGDYILIEDPSRNQLHALPVLTVQSNTHLRCLPSAKMGTIQDARYMIGKRMQVKHTAAISRSDGPTATVDLNGLLTSAPVSSEGFVGWEVETKLVSSKKVSKLKRERKLLTAQYEMYLHEMHELHLRDHLSRVWEQWRAFLADALQQKRRGPARVGWMGRHFSRWQHGGELVALPEPLPVDTMTI
mmetsp:Transcript_30033/g.69973  ORF Transcript_30033/g.69973 Transcript_30033/m.69973 type:complete len:1547 (-) Transcript_30033:62-4702(-)